MRVSVSVCSAYYDGENWPDLVSYVQAADRFGVDTVWSAEAWGMEAVVRCVESKDCVSAGVGIQQKRPQLRSAANPKIGATVGLGSHRQVWQRGSHTGSRIVGTHQCVTHVRFGYSLNHE